jgi:N-methylhydantoinase B
LYLRTRDGVTPVDTESFYSFNTGDIFEIYESGGGGYGDPRRRPADKVLDDVANGLVSVENARHHYGVHIDPETMVVDEQATAKLRAGV